MVSGVWPPPPENPPQHMSALQCVPSNTPYWRITEDIGGHDTEVYDKFRPNRVKRAMRFASNNRR